jgi:hypothetical protein
LTLTNVLFDTDQATVVHVHWNSDTSVFRHQTKIYDPKEFLWNKIKPESKGPGKYVVKPILYTKGPGKYVGLHRMSQYSGFILFHRNSLGS